MAAAVASLSPPPQMPSYSLYFGDLDSRVTESELLDALSRASCPFASIRLCRDSVSGKSLRYAYVNFFSPSDASKALERLNHTLLFDKPMRVMWSHRDPLPRKTGDANLFVKNLDPSVDSAGLQAIFGKFGTVLSCKVAEEDGKRKGFGFVQFDSERSAMAAIESLHDTLLLGKKIYVSKFVKKSERQAASEEPKFTNLYVKNLDQVLTEDQLRQKFSEFGKISSVAIMKDDQGKSRCFGFVSFESPEDAMKAVDAMNGAQLGSKNIFVGRAMKKAEREQFLKHQYKVVRDTRIQKLKASNLYVKNLDDSIDDDKLREHFSGCGQITSAKVMRHNNGISKGFGFVSFSTPDEAKKALATLHGTTLLGKSLYVAIAQSKEDRLKALQLQYAQYTQGLLCSSLPTVVPPGLDPLYYAASHINPQQPIMYQQFDMNMGELLPPNRQSCGTIFPLEISRKQTQHRQTAHWVNESLRQAPHVPYLHFGGVHPINAIQRIEQQRPKKYSTMKMNKEKNCPAGASTQGSTMRKMITASSPLKHKQIIGEFLYPCVQKLQPNLASKITGMLLELNNSDLIKFMDSPESLAVQVEKAAQALKQANAGTAAGAVGA